MWLLAATLNQIIVFTLVLARTSGLVIAAPIYGGAETPAQVRALLSVALAFLIAPTQLASAVPPATLLEYLAAIGIELAVGLSLGYGIMLLLAGMQLAGQIIGLTSGMTLADTFNPGFDTSIPLVSQFLYLLALAVFVAIGGHRLLLQGLLTTFDAMPAGGAFLRPSLLETLITLLSQSLSMAVCAAAPATVALLLATLVLGLISRTLPQLNVMALGFGASSLVALAVLAASLAGMAWAFESAVAPAIETMVESMAGM